MGPKPRLVRQSTDDLAWEKSDEAFDTWEATLHNKTIYLAIGNFILKHKPGEAAELHKPIMGGYNILYRLEYKDGSSVALRIPCKGMSLASKGCALLHTCLLTNAGIVQFPEEKVRYEVATMAILLPTPQFPCRMFTTTGQLPKILLD